MSQQDGEGRHWSSAGSQVTLRPCLPQTCHGYRYMAPCIISYYLCTSSIDANSHPFCALWSSNPGRGLLGPGWDSGRKPRAGLAAPATHGYFRILAAAPATLITPLQSRLRNPSANRFLETDLHCSRNTTAASYQIHTKKMKSQEVEAEVRSWGFAHVFTWSDGPNACKSNYSQTNNNNKSCAQNTTDATGAISLRLPASLAPGPHDARHPPRAAHHRLSAAGP